MVGQPTVGNSARQYETVRDSMRQDSAVTAISLKGDSFISLLRSFSVNI